MICPDDGSDLSEEATGIYACRRCNGRAVARSAFAATHRDVENILEPEHDPDSGAFARERSCPRCRGSMMPLRLGIQLCWVDWCGACGILWFEKLDGYVVERLRKRVALERVVQEMPSKERLSMAKDVAREIGDLERERRELQLMTDLNRWFLWWW